MDYVEIPTVLALAAGHRAELARVRRARYEYRNPGRKHGQAPGTPRPPLDSREFIFWDGEGPRDTGYSLMGNSKGMEICHPHLSTLECLNLIQECEVTYPDAIHAWFGANYDVSNILCDLSWRHLAGLHRNGSTVWRDWEIQHIPHKWLRVKHGQVTATMFDIRSFFAGGLVSVLEEWEIGPWDANVTQPGLASVSDLTVPDVAEMSQMTEREIVERFKKLRSEFTWADIESIRLYMRLELKYSVILINQLRDVFIDAGYLPQYWHGPGALARMAFNRHKVYDAMAETPEAVQSASRFAFAGGRFEQFRAGHVNGKVYSADQNSSYPYFATLLPDLRNGHWRPGRSFEPGKYALYRIRYHGVLDPYHIHPLFRRLASGNVVWPYRVDGWYWSPEAGTVAFDPQAEFVEAWIFDEDTPARRPFAWLEEYYRRRQLLKRIGNPAEYTFKLIINSVYGQTAQRAGWDKKHNKAPRTHQLEWAGFITSGCRAASYLAGKACGDDLVSIDTDGIFSTAPIDVADTGDNLGQWKLTDFDDGLFWQSGIYMLRRGDDWVKAKTRGIPRGSYTAEDMLECYRTGQPLRLAKNTFVTYGLALGGRRDELNTWKQEPYEYVFGGSGKRGHFPSACARDCDGDMHRLAMPALYYGPYDSALSERHYLPWHDRADTELADRRLLIDDTTLYDQNHLDMDDEWVRCYGS